MSVVVFDLDHTIIRCDSFLGFNRELLLRRSWRTALTLVASPFLAALWIPRRTRLAVASTLVWLGTVGLEEDELHALMDTYVSTRFDLDPRLVCRTSVEVLQAHQRSGARVFIATGSEVALARRICARLGIGDVEIVGSTLRRWWGGWIAGEHCFGPRKVAMLIECGAGEHWDFVYSDSAADLPLLTRGARRVVVNPRPSQRTSLETQLGGALEVVEWR